MLTYGNVTIDASKSLTTVIVIQKVNPMTSGRRWRRIFRLNMYCLVLDLGYWWRKIAERLGNPQWQLHLRHNRELRASLRYREWLTFLWLNFEFYWDSLFRTLMINSELMMTQMLELSRTLNNIWNKTILWLLLVRCPIVTQDSIPKQVSKFRGSTFAEAFFRQKGRDPPPGIYISQNRLVESVAFRKR
jgi:hypothetical protein